MSRSAIVSRIAHDSAEHEPPLVTTNTWWSELSADFHRQPETFGLSWRDRVRVSGTAAIDVVARTATATMLSAVAIPIGYSPRSIRESIADREIYERVADAGDIDAFARTPPRGVRLRVRKPRWPYYKPADGFVEDLSFESPYEPINPRMRDVLERERHNRIAHARHWRHQGEPRPTIVAIHGFIADPYWLNEWLFALPWFYRRGYDVFLATLPYHGPRRSRGSLFSGHGFFAQGISGINEAFGQAVFDVRIFLDYLRRHVGVPRVGLTGVSLGGYTTALLSCIDADLAFAMPNVPVASIADLLVEWEPMASVVRQVLRLTRQDIHSLRHILAIHSPLSYPSRLPRERRFIIGGVGDRLAPPKHSRLLWDHWERCRIHWFPGSHLLHLDRGEYLRQALRFMGEIGF